MKSSVACASIGTMIAVGVLSVVTGCAAPGAGVDVVRHRTPGSSFPIAAAVEVPAGATTIYLSGQVPPMTDPSRA